MPVAGRALGVVAVAVGELGRGVLQEIEAPAQQRLAGDLDPGPPAVPALVAALEDSVKAYQVSELLSRASPPMLQRLLAELESITDERALTKALEVCTRAEVAGGAEAMEPFLQHESFLVRYEAARALEAIKQG